MNRVRRGRRKLPQEGVEDTMGDECLRGFTDAYVGGNPSNMVQIMTLSIHSSGFAIIAHTYPVIKNVK